MGRRTRGRELTQVAKYAKLWLLEGQVTRGAMQGERGKSKRAFVLLGGGRMGANHIAVPEHLEKVSWGWDGRSGVAAAPSLPGESIGGG
jgi:hypothetical protein